MDGCRLGFGAGMLRLNRKGISLSLWLLYATYTFQRLAIKVRRNIARIYRYMNAAYPGCGIISNKNRKLFDGWDKMDEVDAWECQRAKRVENIQGNENTFVKSECIKVGLW